ncbi:MAG: Asp23/Gls24 family envelope stress response protein [Synergistaceae bacterium]|nr:Asp23/Gls24 family envelope stress response protein [Synergistaceae bacterium]MBR1658578.1 Asp23/Gls24 family envelope stress response protein [Synergistaceae bacterium]
MSLSDIEVTAFVGPAGTGKSHRATMVARQNGIDVIIDDGLVISRGRILAGRSAKSEINRLRAIKRAIFEYPEHRDEVANYLSKNSPAKLMILATSDGMIDKITGRLGLNHPVRTISITDVSSPEEIEAALRERKEKKQHVVPAAKAQIQQNFAGKLVSQIRGFFKGREKDESRNTIVKPLFSFNGRVTIGSDAILEMTRKLLELRNHVRKIRDIDIETDEDKISLSVELDLNLSGMSALSIAKTLQRKLRMGLSYFTGMEIRQVNIRVNEIFL